MTAKKCRVEVECKQVISYIQVISVTQDELRALEDVDGGYVADTDPRGSGERIAFDTISRELDTHNVTDAAQEFEVFNVIRVK